MKLFEASRNKLAVVVAMSILALSGITRAQTNDAGGAASKMTMPMSDAASMQDKDLKAAMTKMRAQMDTMKMTGKPDDDFATMMRTHHQGAIDMANVELASGKDSELRTMAQKIIDDQTKEIAKLDKWMAKKAPKMK